MENINHKILGQKIKKVIYSEMNHPDGSFYFDGFDSFDHSIQVQMENNSWWHLGWKEEEYFEFGLGQFNQNQFLKPNKIKYWEATDRWNKVRNSKVIGIKVSYVDEAKFIPSQIKINFKNNELITILISGELNLDGSIPYPLDYKFHGEIYVFHNTDLLK